MTGSTRGSRWNRAYGQVHGKCLFQLQAGLRIQFLHEHDHTSYLQCLSRQRRDGEIYRQSEGAPRIPLTYSIRAEKA
jgi:hypothetical protein